MEEAQADAQPAADTATTTVKADWWEADINGASPQVSDDGKSVTLTIKPGYEGEKINSKEVRRWVCCLHTIHIMQIR